MGGLLGGLIRRLAVPSSTLHARASQLDSDDHRAACFRAKSATRRYESPIRCQAAILLRNRANKYVVGRQVLMIDRSLTSIALVLSWVPAGMRNGGGTCPSL